MLKIENLHAEIDGKEILRGLDLEVKPGEIHAIMGPNGAGKSTLAKVLAGDPAYKVTEGSVVYDGLDFLDLEPEERAHKGLFVSFQYPLEIPGISNFQFLKSAICALQKARGIKEVAEEVFRETVEEIAESLQIKKEFLDRDLNSGFSGGEKKRNEILQLLLFNPQFAVLDETDSGLDIDALRVVGEGIKRFASEKKGLILITHYQRLLDTIKPDFVHVMSEGKIIETGDASLALELEEKGYAAD